MYRSTNRLPSLETPPTWPQSSWPAAPSASRPTSGPSAWSCGRSAGYRKGFGWGGGEGRKSEQGMESAREAGREGRKEELDRQTDRQTETREPKMVVDYSFYSRFVIFFNLCAVIFLSILHYVGDFSKESRILFICFRT